MLCLSSWDNIAYEYCLVYIVKYVWDSIVQGKYLPNVGSECTHTLSQENQLFQVCPVAYLLTRCNITKESWLVLFNVGSGVHLPLARQQWTGADTDWNSVIMTVCGDFEYIYLPMWCFVKNFVVYLTKIICVCAYFYWTIVIWQFEFSCLLNTCLLTFFW